MSDRGGKVLGINRWPETKQEAGQAVQTTIGTELLQHVSVCVLNL